MTTLDTAQNTRRNEQRVRPANENNLDRFLLTPLLRLVDALAALLLAADLCVVAASVIARYVFDAPVEWSDDVARGLMVALSFFGAAGAIARHENVGVLFFVHRLPLATRRIVEAAGAVLTAITAIAVAVYALQLAQATTGQTTGSGLPLEWSFYPMGGAGVCMALFSLNRLRHLDPRAVGAALLSLGALSAIALVWGTLWPDSLPDANWPMGAGFLLCLAGGMPIGFVLAFAALLFVWIDGSLPGMIFAQQMARGIDNFVLLAIPFFILVGYLMEANGMSVRIIALLERLVGRLRGGLNVVMVLSMVVFSGISGSKMADVAAVGSVLIPAARRARQNAGGAVALLAASAVMAETIPPCINLIILGFVANLSIGGLFVAGLLPAGLMAVALIGTVIAFGRRPSPDAIDVARVPMKHLWGGTIVTLGLLVMIFGGFRSGFATATEISAFAALYALVIGGVAFREMTARRAASAFVAAATRAGLVLFIVAAAQAVAFLLTLQQIPQHLAQLMIALTAASGSWLFLLLSVLVLIVMGSMLEGAAALIIFGPLLVPVAGQLGIDTLHYGVVLVIAMGIGLFAPPLGLGLYGACLIGDVPIEVTVKPMLRYLALLFVCLLVIAFVPAITTWLPRRFGY
jgi:tripartite ATP-independent transporter DctM subunit